MTTFSREIKHLTGNFNGESNAVIVFYSHSFSFPLLVRYSHNHSFMTHDTVMQKIIIVLTSREVFGLIIILILFLAQRLLLHLK